MAAALEYLRKVDKENLQNSESKVQQAASPQDQRQQFQPTEGRKPGLRPENSNCFHCGRPGHYSVVCPEKHGYAGNPQANSAGNQQAAVAAPAGANYGTFQPNDYKRYRNQATEVSTSAMAEAQEVET